MASPEGQSGKKFDVATLIPSTKLMWENFGNLRHQEGISKIKKIKTGAEYTLITIAAAIYIAPYLAGEIIKKINARITSKNKKTDID